MSRRKNALREPGRRRSTTSEAATSTETAAQPPGPSRESSSRDRPRRPAAAQQRPSKTAARPRGETQQAAHGGRLATKGAFATLEPRLQEALAVAGYETPTPIQEECIPHLLDGRDLLGCAQTGTGKTAAFTLPMLQLLAGDTSGRRSDHPRALILAPTRELAAQIGQSIADYGRFLRLRHTVLFGGVNQNPQTRALERGIDILVATPGRLLDLMGQGYVSLHKVSLFVLDEADRMLDMGFVPDVKRVLAELPKERQTLFFSATLPPKIRDLAGTMVHDPVRVTITPEAPAVERIDQKVLFVAKREKDALLASLFDDPTMTRAVVFTQMKHMANRVVQKLERAGIPAMAIHGNKSQSARTRALDGFKKGRFRALVATDVAARGLDVNDITHVVNYDLPVEPETYVHRIGRTARAGADGSAVSLCTPEDRAYLRQIERLLGSAVPSDLEHPLHSEEARSATQPAPGGFGRRSPRRRSPSNPPAGRRPRRARRRIA